MEYLYYLYFYLILTYHSRSGKLKNPHCSMVMSAEYSIRQNLKIGKGRDPSFE